jgi:hypothetical protein
MAVAKKGAQDFINSDYRIIYLGELPEDSKGTP